MHQYFTKEYLDFFKELRKNNSTSWFHENKKRYEKHVKEPFKAFVFDLIREINQIESEVKVLPKDCILRINRDIRFSKDKTPYNVRMAVIVSEKGRKDKSFPGIYLQLSDENLCIYGGIYRPSQEQLKKIREAIKKDTKGFKKLINNKTFKDGFGELRSEKYKRIPKEYQDLIDSCPEILNKSFTYGTELPTKHITSKDLMKVVIDYYKKAKPFKDFLIKTIE